jgi:hypothetical protein
VFYANVITSVSFLLPHSYMFAPCPECVSCWHSSSFQQFITWSSVRVCEGLVGWAALAVKCVCLFPMVYTICLSLYHLWHLHRHSLFDAACCDQPPCQCSP